MVCPLTRGETTTPLEVCIWCSHRLHNSVSSSVPRGSWRDNQSNTVCRYAFWRWGRRGADVRQYSQCSQEGLTQVKQKSMFPHWAHFCGGWGKKDHIWLSSAVPSSLSWWKSNVASMIFSTMHQGSQSGLSLSNVDLAWFKKIIIFTILAFKCTHLIV